MREIDGNLLDKQNKIKKGKLYILDEISVFYLLYFFTVCLLIRSN